MPDRESVIRQLTQHIARAENIETDWIDCVSISMLRGALELLKKQEPIPCGEKIKAGDVMLDFYECGYCKNAIRKPWKYCPFCGKAVKWND